MNTTKTKTNLQDYNPKKTKRIARESQTKSQEDDVIQMNKTKELIGLWKSDHSGRQGTRKKT